MINLTQKAYDRSRAVKPGGQKGRKGTTLQQTSEAEYTRYHPVKGCDKCLRSVRDKKPIKLIERQVFEPGRFGHFEVTTHVAEVKECGCGHVTYASFPEGVNSHVQYGPVTCLNIPGKKLFHSHVQYGPVTQALAVYLLWIRDLVFKRTSTPADFHLMPELHNRCLTSVLHAASVTPEPVGQLCFKAC